jgi:hypothetical protein
MVLRRIFVITLIVVKVVFIELLLDYAVKMAGKASGFAK